MKTKANAKESSNQIDLTPMLDVVFIMLIFFIITASFVKERGMAMAEQPKPDNDNTNDSVTLVFTVASDNEISLDGRRVDIRSIRSIIAQEKAINPAANVVLKAHEHASVDRYVAVLDAARQESITQVALSTYE